MRGSILLAFIALPGAAICDGELKPKDSKLRYRISAFFTADSNIERDDKPVSSIGKVLVFGVTYKNPIPKPNFVLDYEIGRHDFTNSSTYDRVSHQLSAEYSRKLSRLWEATVDAEISLKGSNEDRELFDQYLVKPGIEYRLNDDTRLLFEQAFRRRTYEDPNESSANTYSQLTLKRRLGDGKRVALAVRKETNNAETNKYDFERTSYALVYQQELSKKSRLELEARLKYRDYDSRTIKKRNDPLRRDRNLILSALYESTITDNWLWSLEFRYEKRDSNELDKKFNETRFILGFTHRW